MAYSKAVSPPQQRRDKILEILKSAGRIRPSDIQKHFHLGESTARNDLKRLRDLDPNLLEFRGQNGTGWWYLVGEIKPHHSAGIGRRRSWQRNRDDGVPLDGRAAFESGWTEDANPHEPNSVEARYWRADWLLADAESYEAHLYGDETHFRYRRLRSAV